MAALMMSMMMSMLSDDNIVFFLPRIYHNLSIVIVQHNIGALFTGFGGLEINTYQQQYQRKFEERHCDYSYCFTNQFTVVVFADVEQLQMNSDVLANEYDGFYSRRIC